MWMQCLVHQVPDSDIVPLILWKPHSPPAAEPSSSNAYLIAFLPRLFQPVTYPALAIAHERGQQRTAQPAILRRTLSLPSIFYAPVAHIIHRHSASWGSAKVRANLKARKRFVCFLRLRAGAGCLYAGDAVIDANSQREVLPSKFTCLFCNHEDSVAVKLDKKAGVDLSAAVDVYGEWVDAADAVAKEAGPVGGSNHKTSSARRPPTSRPVDDDDDDRRYGGEGIDMDDDEY
ncbi:hypothetical protein CCUS01_07809 [Colletotrichum cuscutae]|uniref:Transcription elongation factor 1 homolog n=1 Tax=Colletotrichum cuscutae TaxID=1209917 RepID=A0AAI9XXN5_9PEZI|nr:hypothetical protein CCUS01_07809 [Colletotrichum cuscutae]